MNELMNNVDDCQSCKGLKVDYEIRTPGELKKALEIGKDYVASGVLKVVPEESTWSEPFDQVKLGGPWDDIVSYVFRCNSCGKKFELTAETYHGRGGHWKPLRG